MGWHQTRYTQLILEAVAKLRKLLVTRLVARSEGALDEVLNPFFAARRSASSSLFLNAMHTARPCGSSQSLDVPGDKLGGKV